MKKLTYALGVAFFLAVSRAQAGAPVTAAPDQQALLKSSDPQLADNKKLVYDFWRVVLEAGHFDETEKYMAEDYINHNPNGAQGRQGFINFFKTVFKIKTVPVEPTIKRPLVNILAEGDTVLLTFVSEKDNPSKPGEKYTTTWFDMFRIKNGKIVEHWDNDLMDPAKAAGK
jgi:predicted SnoaL-like aldol condensation-catalyzing enzyme